MLLIKVIVLIILLHSILSSSPLNAQAASERIMSSHEMYEIRSMPSMQTLQIPDIELGITDVLHKHLTRHVAATRPVSQRRLNFEHARPRWLREMVAEATGVFFYGIVCFIAHISTKNCILTIR